LLIRYTQQDCIFLNEIEGQSMITSLKVKGFAGVPYLETSALMKRHKGKVVFSTDKPNVIVGPNGAGKSALLSALALETLTYFTGESSFSPDYIDERKFWTPESDWKEPYRYKFLPGLTCESDKGPAFYYRPGHVPGNDRCLTTAMMCGYSEEANRVYELTKEKSSGQQAQALMQKLLGALSGTQPLPEYYYTAWWRGGKEVKDPDSLRGGPYIGESPYKTEALKARYANVPADARLVILADEPEQSLDALAQLKLWNRVAAADCSKVQVIIASHSLYPLMYPEKFNLIEAVPGFIDEVRSNM
jgi:energy-coupling factor transporter ATP-binding protein EcfA2